MPCALLYFCCATFCNNRVESMVHVCCMSDKLIVCVLPMYACGNGVKTVVVLTCIIHLHVGVYMYVYIPCSHAGV